jgi:cobalt-zinc-cadmium efflux system membrane fusion protein
VRFDPERVAAVGARIAGRVRVLRKLEGDAVAAGDVLAEIESAELGEAQAAVLAARANAVAAEANEKRERQLAEAKISASRDAEAAAATAAAARASLAAAEQRVRAMGGGQGEAGVLIVRSPIAGKVVERNLTRGQFVEPTLTAFRVADLHRVWIELAVFERDLHALRGGDRVDIRVPGSGAASMFGTVTYVGDVVDLQTKTAKVRVVVDQAEPSLRPGQSVLATIHVSAPRAQRSVLPRDAVTTVDGKPTVFVASGELAVQARGVELGAQDATQVEIVSGIQVGERVASAGVLALKSEIFR